MSSFKEGLITRLWPSGKTGLIFQVKDRNEEALPSFIPGHYTALSLNPSDPNFTRAYSICSTPEDDYWEFLVALVPGGFISEKLAKLKEGDIIYYRTNPKGQLTIKKIAPSIKSVVLVGTGSGIGPYKSILGSVVKNPELNNLRFTLLQGARYSSEVHYYHTFKDLEGKLNMEYKIFVSREEPENLSYASRGRVTDYFTQQFIETLDPNTSIVFLCGNPDMLDELTNLLGSFGFSKEKGNLVLESYW